MRTLLTYAAGAVIGLGGAMLVAAYVVEAVLKRSGEADQSLLFWYLPVLFMGIVGIAAGIAVVVLGRYRSRRSGPNPATD